MSVHIRPLVDRDFFSWLALYEEYGEFYKTPITDEKALLVWSWISDSRNELEGRVAVDDENHIIGLIHFQTFVRPLHASRGIYIDDLYVDPQKRKNGVGTQLLDYVRGIAKDQELSVIRLITTADNTPALELYTSVGADRTDWVTFDIAPQ